jgi:hypothetical protein
MSLFGPDVAVQALQMKSIDDDTPVWHDDKPVWDDFDVVQYILQGKEVEFRKYLDYPDYGFPYLRDTSILPNVQLHYSIKVPVNAEDQETRRPEDQKSVVFKFSIKQYGRARHYRDPTPPPEEGNTLYSFKILFQNKKAFFKLYKNISPTLSTEPEYTVQRTCALAESLFKRLYGWNDATIPCTTESYTINKITYPINTKNTHKPINTPAILRFKKSISDIHPRAFFWGHSVMHELGRPSKEIDHNFLTQSLHEAFPAEHVLPKTFNASQNVITHRPDEVLPEEPYYSD